MQVIIYTNTSGGVSVCVPTGEMSIEEVQQKDTPAGSLVMDDSALPTGDDALFFGAWRLHGSTVSVDIPTAITQQTSALNQMAYLETQHRTTKAGVGLANVMADADWTTTLSTARAAIVAATTTTQLVAALTPIQVAIAANAAL